MTGKIKNSLAKKSLEEVIRIISDNNLSEIRFDYEYYGGTYPYYNNNVTVYKKDRTKCKLSDLHMNVNETGVIFTCCSYLIARTSCLGYKRSIMIRSIKKENEHYVTNDFKLDVPKIKQRDILNVGETPVGEVGVAIIKLTNDQKVIFKRKYDLRYIKDGVEVKKTRLTKKELNLFRNKNCEIQYSHDGNDRIVYNGDQLLSKADCEAEKTLIKKVRLMLSQFFRKNLLTEKEHSLYTSKKRGYQTIKGVTISLDDSTQKMSVIISYIRSNVKKANQVTITLN